MSSSIRTSVTGPRPTTSRSVHGHFVCEECGRLIEVPEAMFDGLAKQARTRFGFTIDPHHFAMLGRCADCS